MVPSNVALAASSRYLPLAGEDIVRVALTLKEQNRLPKKFVQDGIPCHIAEPKEPLQEFKMYISAHVERSSAAYRTILDDAQFVACFSKAYKDVYPNARVGNKDRLRHILCKCIGEIYMSKHGSEVRELQTQHEDFGGRLGTFQRKSCLFVSPIII